jgi:predicted AlkP superfamily phosphohydrolase/phosphomutase
MGSNPFSCFEFLLIFPATWWDQVWQSLCDCTCGAVRWKAPKCAKTAWKSTEMGRNPSTAVSETFLGVSRHIRGESLTKFVSQSCQDTPIRRLEYWMRIARESTRTYIEYVSDTGYVVKRLNLDNLGRQREQTVEE